MNYVLLNWLADAHHPVRRCRIDPMTAFLLVIAQLAAVSCVARPPRLAEATSAPATELRAELSGSRPAITVQKNVLVPMRDGVRLATDVYRPAGGGKYPVVLIRTPYGSETPEYASRARYYVEHGYALAVQDCRGKYDSEGDWYGPRDEGNDTNDAISWLGIQSWSSGSVGMTGASYLGMVQYLVAGSGNPFLKALVPLVAPLTLGRDTSDFDHLAVYANRESASTFDIQWMVRTDGRVSQSDPAYTLATARDHLPMSDYPGILGREMKWWPFLVNHRYGFWEEYFLRAAAGDWREHRSDGAWWAGYEERYRNVSVPILGISGWFDCCAEPVTRNFQMIRKLSTVARARDNQHLLLGPWTHNTLGKARLGDVDFGARAQLNVDSVAIRWFDRWLKGEDNGVEKEPVVRVFVMGENRWREATDWPIPSTQYTNFYLHSSGEARLAHGGGRLSLEPPKDEQVDRYVYDPGQPTPAQLGPGEIALGPADRAALEKRDDVLVYTSDLLKDALEVTGPLSAVLYAATSAPSTDYLVRLIDVHPDGTAYNVFQIYATAPFRSHWAKQMETERDGARISKAEIWLPPTSVTFPPGHRIRVEISSAFAPVFRGLNVAPGTELNATSWNVAQQTIYHDRSHPSHIVLPVIHH